MSAGTPDPGLAARIADVLRAWDAIPGHRTASADDDVTAAWLADEIRARGAVPALDAFPVRRRTPGACHVEVGGNRLDGEPCLDGGTTEAGGVEGPIGPLGSAAPIGLARVSPAPAHPSVAALRAARDDGAHRAIVTIAADAGTAPGLTLVNAPDFAHPGGPPVVQLPTDAGAVLDAAVRRGDRVRVRATMTETDASATNVSVRIAGADPDLAPLVVMTPRSGWWRCTAERGGGIAAWLEAVAMLVRRRPSRTVRFTANSGHELGHLGLRHLLAREPALAAGAHAWVHLGANIGARAGRTRFQASDESLLALRAELDAQDVTAPRERPGGEAAGIFDAGGRYVSVLGSGPLFHHPDDRWPDAVDLDRTAHLAGSLLAIIERLARP